MTNDIELLPLPDGWNARILNEWCRANVAHATAAKDAEIEALRVEVERWKVLDLEWLNKTEWVQQTGRPSELGRHRADVMRLRLEQAESSAERLDAAGRRVTAAFRAHGETTPFTREAERTRHECEDAMLALDSALKQENDDAR